MRKTVNTSEIKFYSNDQQFLTMLKDPTFKDCNGKEIFIGNLVKY